MNKRRILALVLACVLCVCIGIGGTLAWLTAQTTTVVNTFTVGDINITLTETTGPNYNFVPGDKIAKDPKVTVKANSEDCYLFIHVTDANNNITDETNNGKIINWVVANGWAPVAGHDGYWSREVAASNTDTTFAVLTDGIADDGKDGSVTVSTEVTKAMVTDLTTNKPTITVTAAAVQKDNVSETDAWAKLPTSFTNPTT